MEAIVLYPSPGMGHLVSMVELGKLILKHHPSFSIIILTIIPTFNTGSTAAYVRHVSSTVPSITFHHLPTISLPLDPSVYRSMEAIIFEHLRLSNPHVHDALQSISLSTTISAFVIDFFCTPALPVASTFSIPTYYFFTSGAACLAMLLYLPTIHKSTTKSLKDIDTPLDIPGLPPIPTLDLPEPMHDRAFTEYASFLNFANHLTRSAGIIVNTFESLEPKPLKAMSDGSCIPDGPTPPLFCTGPIIMGEDRGGDGDVHECLKWLDLQPSKSVVFLCFGSLGLFSANQLKEIAIGLEKSKVSFLWVVRSPPSEDKSTRFLAPPAPELDLLLPDGFLDRTKNRGLVVKSWAPQVSVLNHDSVGGFVTHCGWNSVLEATRAGVPMVAWPLYAEQKLNRDVLVEEMKLALPMKASEGGLVMADEVEKRDKELMESEEGECVRAKAKEKRRGKSCNGGDDCSSRRSLAKFVESWKLSQ